MSVQKRFIRLCTVMLALLLVLSLVPARSVFAAGLVTQSLKGGLTPTDLANTLVGSGVTISNVTYKGADVAAGKFSGGTGIIGFEDGIILSSGDIANVVGPNSADNITAVNDTDGDPDLAAISGQDTHDAAVLEFDFVPDNDKVSFQYVFSSDEYNEYVGNEESPGVNDAFAFFVNGVNCAKLPDGTPLTIDNVNKDKNSAYFRNNDPSDGTPTINTEMDGLTVVLTCTATVSAGKPNHIKLVIADASDYILDSNVFLKAGSFTTVGDITLSPASATNAVGTSHALTATVTENGAPRPNTPVTFTVLSGPHAGTIGQATSNADGVATFAYTGQAVGTDTIQSSFVNSAGQTKTSNTVTKLWVASAATYALDLSWTAGGSATASPAGPTYPAGTAVTLTAKADIGYAFTGWTVGGVAVGAGNPLVLTMNAGYDVVASFAPGSDGVPGWSAYGAQGGPLTSAPAATSFNGKVYVFARGSDNGLYVKNTVGDGFTAWRALGGDLIGAPAAAVLKGRLYVFARGAGDALYMKSSADGVTFTEWRSLGGKLTDAPAAASVNNVLYIFASGTGRALYMKSSLNGVDYTDWKSLGGELTAAPAAAGFKGQVYVFAKGSDNALYERHSNNGVNFSNWLRLDGVLLAAPGAATYTNASGAEQLYVFAHGTDGGLWERHTGNGVGYSNWVSLGGQLDGAPAAAGVKGRLYAFVRWANDVLAERHTLR